MVIVFWYYGVFHNYFKLLLISGNWDIPFYPPFRDYLTYDVWLIYDEIIYSKKNWLMFLLLILQGKKYIPNKKWLLQIYHIKYLYRIVPCYTCIKLWISSFELEYYKGKKCKFLLILSIKYNKNQTRFNIMHFHY